MASTSLIAVRVRPETKAKFQAIAGRQQLTVSALLNRMIELAIESAGLANGAALTAPQREARSARLYVRLRADDQQLLSERAAARRMAGATYVSVLVRAHLRSMAPLPKDELTALKRCLAELGAIGRNLNQIARATHEGARVTGPSREDLRLFVKVCDAMRSHVKALITANVRSWETGHGES